MNYIEVEGKQFLISHVSVFRGYGPDRVNLTISGLASEVLHDSPEIMKYYGGDVVFTAKIAEGYGERLVECLGLKVDDVVNVERPAGEVESVR